MKKCKLVLTDSGGIQEEAPALGKPVLVLRETTERPEGVEAGTAELVGLDQTTITNKTNELLSDESTYNGMAKATNPYGAGDASSKIVKLITERYAKQV
jgi:UDP-N-acetylglucosamine 2-epimerase (non-hydrolysing)